MNLVERARQVLDERGYDDWTVIHSSALECPHGHRVEWDGACPDGCVSPFRELGLI